MRTRPEVEAIGPFIVVPRSFKKNLRQVPEVMLGLFCDYFSLLTDYGPLDVPLQDAKRLYNFDFVLDARMRFRLLGSRAPRFQKV